MNIDNIIRVPIYIWLTIGLSSYVFYLVWYVVICYVKEKAFTTKWESVNKANRWLLRKTDILVYKTLFNKKEFVWDKQFTWIPIELSDQRMFKKQNLIYLLILMPGYLFYWIFMPLLAIPYGYASYKRFRKAENRYGLSIMRGLAIEMKRIAYREDQWKLDEAIQKMLLEKKKASIEQLPSGLDVVEQLILDVPDIENVTKFVEAIVNKPKEFLVGKYNDDPEVKKRLNTNAIRLILISDIIGWKNSEDIFIEYKECLLSRIDECAADDKINAAQMGIDLCMLCQRHEKYTDTVERSIHKLRMNSLIDKARQKGVEKDFRKVLEEIRKRIKEVSDRSEKTIADELGITVNQLKYMLKKCGVNFESLYLNERMDKAKEMLRDPKCLIKDIALDCGYSDPSHLTNEFKNRNGCTPSEYKEMAVKHLIMQAEALLKTDDYYNSEVSEKLGFPSVEEFRETFKKHTGISPEEFEKTAIPPASSSATKK